MLIVSRLMVFFQIQDISVSIWLQYANTLRFKFVMFKHRIMYVQPACYALLYIMCMYCKYKWKIQIMQHSKRIM